MSSTSWPSSFDELLRSYLSLEESQELAPDMNPVDHGLNSMATVSLLLDLEERYGLTIPDDQLATLATANVGQMWALLVEVGAVRDDVEPAGARAAHG